MSAPAPHESFRINPRWNGRPAAPAIGEQSRKWALHAASALIEGAILPVLIIRALMARATGKAIDAGFGPDPLINNVHHRKAMVMAGYTAQTFCIEPYFITNAFDRVFVQTQCSGFPRLLKLFVARIGCMLWVMGRFRVLYTNFAGGPLAPMVILGTIEPWLLRLAGVRTVMLPFGGDVHVPERLANLTFRYALDFDYPQSFMRADRVRRNVRRWSREADCVLAGCDWVDCLDHCDILCYSHFTIDSAQWDAPAQQLPEAFSAQRPLRILHAPNHRAIKGSDAFIAAVAQLQSKGCHIELVLMERKSNDTVRGAIESVDVVADQLVIGWYAMFAIEGMAMRRAVICNIREDLVAMHQAAGTAPPDGFPFVQATCATVVDAIESLYRDPQLVTQAATRGRTFVERYHSLEAGARLFGAIQTRLGF